MKFTETTLALNGKDIVQVVIPREVGLDKKKKPQ